MTVTPKQTDNLHRSRLGFHARCPLKTEVIFHHEKHILRGNDGKERSLLVSDELDVLQSVTNNWKRPAFPIW